MLISRIESYRAFAAMQKGLRRSFHLEQEEAAAMNGLSLLLILAVFLMLGWMIDVFELRSPHSIANRYNIAMIDRSTRRENV
jgi:flagellar biogenesis protein FliO